MRKRVFIERIHGLVDLVSLIPAAVRGSIAIARTEKALAAVAVNQTLERLGMLYGHKFQRLLEEMEKNLKKAQQSLATGGVADAQRALGSTAEFLVNLKNAHDDLWKRLKSASRIAPIRVSEVVTRILKEEEFTNKKYVTVDTAVLDAMPPVRASGLLEEHLRNLLNNAVRAIEEQKPNPPEYKGQIAISAERHAPAPSDAIAALNERVRLTIRDNGIGLPREMQEKIFENGYSGWGSTGYGLPAARQYARELGGNVNAVGGIGCTIVVDLPVYVPGEHDDAEPAVDRQ